MCLRIFLFAVVTQITIDISTGGVLPSQRTLSRHPRLSIVDWDGYNTRDEGGPGSYSFGYDIEDPETNNIQTRSEERYSNGTVVGSYGYVQPDGTVLLVNYVADARGYRATVETNPRGMVKPIRVPKYSDPNIFNRDQNSVVVSKLFPNMFPPGPRQY